MVCKIQMCLNKKHRWYCYGCTYLCELLLPPFISGLSSDDLLQESLGHSKVEAGTEMLRGLIEELSSLKYVLFHQDPSLT